MIQFYFHSTPNAAKVALLLEEASLPCEAIPIDTNKGEQHAPGFRAINPNGKVPAVVDTEGPCGKQVRVFDSTAILIYLAEKMNQFLGATTDDRPELLSWLLFIASGLGPFSGQAIYFQYAVPFFRLPEINCPAAPAYRYRREAERHYKVLDDHLSDRDYIVGSNYTIADMSAWGWIDRASKVLEGEDDALAPFPALKRWFSAIDGRPAVSRAREAKRALFPSNYPPSRPR